MNGYILVERTPTTEEYRNLREAVGWGNADSAATEAGLENSLFSVCVLSDDEVIGCGRIVGDGGMYFYLQDVMVLPEFQGQGIGRRIMDSLMEHLDEHAHAKAFIGLMASKGAAGFYMRFGFSERPSEGPGMFMVME
jgi:GNAT superfamily N-acetyltransferase